MPLLNSLKKIVLDLIFPIQCLGCKYFSDRYICSQCREKIELTSRYFCIFCNTQTSYRQICLKCSKNHALDQCISAVSYKQPLVRLMVSTFKYGFVRDISGEMSGFLIILLRILEQRGLIDFDSQNSCVIPVPLSYRRLRWRGFNQAELLAKNIARNFKIPVHTDILLRKKHNTPQIEITNKKERRKNVKKIFACHKSKRIENKIILLIDDVITTGSTLNECAKVLKSSGAKRVIGITFAR